LVRKAMLVQTVKTLRMETLAQLDQLDHRDQLDKLEHWEQQVQQAPLDLLERMLSIAHAPVVEQLVQGRIQQARRHKKYEKGNFSVKRIFIWTLNT